LTTHCLIHGKGRVMHLKQPKNRPISIFWSKCNHVKPIFFPVQQEMHPPMGWGNVQLLLEKTSASDMNRYYTWSVTW
jgi:hypothetical protein